MASIRIVSADYYMSYPYCDLDVVYSEFRGTEVRQVPIIQIYGSTQEGKKTCLNIHGVFPYVYIPYDGVENPGVLSYKLASELDKTINISLGQGSSNTCHVHNIILTSGIPIYGYHEKYHQFFKIYFYNPAIIKKACSLLENGAILGKCFQPHESHISYILQFMIDYNLHGMSFINVSTVKYRPNPKYPDQLTLPKDQLLPSSLVRRSVCELELDCFACDITNVDRGGSNPGIAALWEDERQRRRDHSQPSQISFKLSQERSQNPEPTLTHEFFAQRLADKLSQQYSDESLDESVYPAETPEDADYLITPANLTSANTSMFDDTLVPDSQTQELSQTDKNLLEILKELKENVHIDEDSALSQQAEPEVDGSSGPEDDEELINNVEVAEDIWNDSFWDGNCEFPQLDGMQDVKSVFMDDGTSDTESLSTMGQEFRYANEVFIKQLNPGVNTLVTTEPKNEVPEKSRVKILSDLLVKPDCNVKLTWQLVAKKQVQVQLNIEKKDDFVDPLPDTNDDIDFENDLDEYDMNEIILNDVNMGNLTPSPMDTLLDELSPKTPNAHANQCSCRQSPCSGSGNRLFAEDSLNLFGDGLYSYSPLSGDKDKENVAINVQKSRKKTLNSVKRDLKLAPSIKVQYNLRSLENTPKEKKCCKLCLDGCAKRELVPEDHAEEEDKKVLVVEETPETKVKKPQLRLWQLLRRKRKKKLNTKGERILVQIPLAKIFRKAGRPKVQEQSDAASTISTTSSEDAEQTKLNTQIAELKINEKNNNKIISAENELINIPIKQSESSSTESEESSSASSSSRVDLTNLKKLQLMNWNLDGQNDTPSSDSEHSQKNGLPKDKDKESCKSGRTRSGAQKAAPKFRVSGLMRKSNKIETRQTQKKKNHLEEKLMTNEQIELAENGGNTSPRLLRNRKSANVDCALNAEEDKVCPKVLRKRKTEVEANKQKIDEQTSDEFKENKIVNVEENPAGRLRNKSRYSEAERNLKRQKRLSLSLKHLREKHELKDNLKELRVSLTQMPLDDLKTTTTTTTPTIKNLKIILEPLSPELLEKYSSNKSNCNESSPVENGNQRTENKRVTRQSCVHTNASDSCEEIEINATIIEEDLVKKLNTTPKKKQSPSPKKYPPLNVTKSPRLKLNVETEEPLKKRLRNFDSNVIVSNSEHESLTKKMKSCAIRVDDDCSRGIGELQDIPIIQEEDDNVEEISENLQILIHSPQINNNNNNNNNSNSKNCDNSIITPPKSANRNSLLKTPDSVKTNLFNTTPSNSNNNNNNNNNSVIDYKTFWKEKEENFLNEIESICKNYDGLNSNSNSNGEQFKTPPKVITTPKKSIITSADYLDYSPFSSPEKGAVTLPFLCNSRETLSQQCEKELEQDSIENYTKTKNLTIAELYDLERNYAPQPGTSKDFTDQNIATSDNSNIWMPMYHPPTRDDIQNSLVEHNIPEHQYTTPFYGNPADATGRVDVGHNVLKIPSRTIAELEEFKSSLGFEGIETWRRDKLKELYPNADVPKTNLYTSLVGHSECVIQPMLPPPSRAAVIEWLKTKLEKIKQKKPEKIRIVIPSSPGNTNEDSDVSFTLSPDVISSTPPPPPQEEVITSESPSLRSRRNTRRGTLQRKALFSSIKSSPSLNNSCQITGVTLNNTHDFKLSYENLQNAKALNENQHLTILIVELHVRTRGDLNPDPQFDAIRAIFYSICNDVPPSHHLPKQETGVIAVNTLPQSPSKKPPPPILDGLGLNCNIQYVDSELQLINALIELIQKWDPDILSGFEIELLSWGYLIERCYTMGINLPAQISRTNPEINKKKHENFEPSKEELKLSGRIVLDAWRLFRHEIALTSYTFENLMYHILHQRVPQHSFKMLSFWWDHRKNHYRKITADYYVTRTEGILKLMDQLDLIGRTAELARLFGIQFYEVLSRGSQFRVESMMLRLAKPLNYISVSPSVQQRAKMRAPEWIPLIFEPESRFYVDPIIVLDFQSLYPSIIIAYNYCFSTCVGRVEKLGTNQPFEFGATHLKVPRRTLERLKENLTFSPCGVGFVSAKVRRGILPRMLQEILETRLMVKASMKQNKEDKLLQRVLHSRQLGLKLIANVTYGYTAANFSGRMPCSEVGDSVVSKGRETLERAIRLIEKCEKWRARVVYGDTDSLFVQVKGRTRTEAFAIGEEIADAVTRDNPAPVKLKLEKVYQPCILQTKKRYVGYMYESVDQKNPEYSAKGIETVRRDGCPAVAKMLEKSLRILFETRNVSLVKRYVCHQFEKIVTGRASVQDLVFAKEYRGAGGYRPGACVPALELARRWTAVDKRKEPRRGERVPYIVVHGPPGVPLIRLVRCPRDLLNVEHNQQIAYRPNAVYYITKVIIPPLNRCFTLIGVDVNTWYNEMPRKQIQILPTDVHLERSKKSTISEYFATMNCAVCNNQTREGLCEECLKKPQETIVTLQVKIHKWERSCYEINQICECCCGRNDQLECTSLDCPILYRLIQSKRDMKQVPFLRNLINKF